MGGMEQANREDERKGQPSQMQRVMFIFVRVMAQANLEEERKVAAAQREELKRLQASLVDKSDRIQALQLILDDLVCAREREGGKGRQRLIQLILNYHSRFKHILDDLVCVREGRREGERENASADTRQPVD